MSRTALFRRTVLLLLLVFPVQLLALAYLPCRHAAAPFGEPLPNCHSSVVDRTGHEQSQLPDENDPAPMLQDCSKCQMQLVFSSMHGNDPVRGKVANAAALAIREPLPHFYHLYPDSLKRPPRPIC
jgi:hypothetical protein